MKRIKLLVIVFIACLVGNGIYSQDVHKGKVGLTATVQDNQFGVMLPVFLSEKFSLAPAVDFKMAQGLGTDLSVGIIPRFYLKTGDMMPYLGLKFGALFYFPDGDKKSTLDFMTGVAFGGEYFFNEHFSLGIEAQGNFTISDKSSERFGNPGKTNFNLGTQVSASIYF